MTNPSPEVSVIIPAYNRKQYLRQAIESVLSQTYQDYELIIIDDGSSDGTSEWVAENYPSINLVSLPKNRGAAAARNEGIGMARGSLIAFLDSDDCWMPNYLEMQVKALQQNADAVLAYCNYLLIKKDGSQIALNMKPWKMYPNMIHHLLMENTIQSMSLVVVRHEALLKAGLLNETLKICHDRELYLRLLYFGNIVHVPENLLLKVMHDGNLVGNYSRWAKEALMVLDIFFADERSQPYKYLEGEARSHWSIKLAKLVLQERYDVVFVLEMMVQAIWFNPGLIAQRLGRRLAKFITNK